MGDHQQQVKGSHQTAQAEESEIKVARSPKKMDPNHKRPAWQAGFTATQLWSIAIERQRTVDQPEDYQQAGAVPEQSKHVVKSRFFLSVVKVVCNYEESGLHHRHQSKIHGDLPAHGVQSDAGEVCKARAVEESETS